jgi:transposase
MEAHSGNASDKKVLHESVLRMQNFCKQLKETPAFLFIGDSAMYEGCLKKANNLLWLSHVPERHTLVKETVTRPDGDFCWTQLEGGYKICVVESRYQGVHQHFVIVYSEQAFFRENKTLDKRVKEEAQEAERILWHLGNQKFSCEADAQKAVKGVTKTFKYHTATITVVPVKKHRGRGRPAKGVEAIKQGYQVQSEVKPNEEAIERYRREKGRFILATNQLDRAMLPDQNILSEYKEQSKTESGFRFIKDNTFEVSSIFLKKPERIAALMMVMTLCLMVYAVAQYQFRQSLKLAGDTILNQRKRETTNPTMKWVYRLFHGVQVITVHTTELIQQIVINLTDMTRKIVHYFGKKAEWIYGLA